MKRVMAFVCAALLAFTTLFAGCATYQTFPSVCDTITERSVLCETADKIGVRLEEVGNVLIVANTVAITEGLYTAEQANAVFRKIIELLGGEATRSFITYEQFKLKIREILDKYPSLMIVADSYLDMFMSSQTIITEVDKQILIEWLDGRIQVVEKKFPKG